MNQTNHLTIEDLAAEIGQPVHQIGAALLELTGVTVPEPDDDFEEEAEEYARRCVENALDEARAVEAFRVEWELGVAVREALACGVDVRAVVDRVLAEKGPAK